MTKLLTGFVLLVSGLFPVLGYAGTVVEWNCSKQMETITGDKSGKLTVLAIWEEKGRKSSYRYKIFYTNRSGAGASAVINASVHPNAASDIYYGDDGTQLIVGMEDPAGKLGGGMVQIRDEKILSLMSARSFQKDVTVDQVTVAGLICKR